jgi:HK97 family phage portal protein
VANRLGHALRYLTDAVQYATVPFRSKKSVSMWNAALHSMAQQGTLAPQETMDVDGILRLAITSSWCYAAIKLIADRTASHDAWPEAKRRKGETLISLNNHAFEQLLRRPNSLMTTDFILSYTTWWAKLMGNAYLFIATQGPGVGTPEELWPLPANLVKPKPETLRRSRLTGGQCIDYEYSIGGRIFTLPGENIVHIREPNPFDYWNGLSPLSAAMMGLKIDKGEEDFIYAHYTDDNAVPPSIISLPAEISPHDFEFAKEQIREQFAGKKRTAITRAGDLHVQIIQQTMEQMQHLETRKFNREQIFLVYGVPEGMLTGGVSGDSRLATEIAFTRNTVQPYINRIASEMTANLAPYYPDDIEIHAPIIIPQDRSLGIQEYGTYSQDRTINENRQKLDLPPIDMEGILKLINKERETFGLEAVNLADASIPLMLALPIRLHPFISSNTFAQGGGLEEEGEVDEEGGAEEPEQGYPYGNQPAPPEVGDMPGMWGPENFVDNQAVRSAMILGIETELGRWEKVALKELHAGRKPAERTFSSPAIPDYLIERIKTSLNVHDESSIRKVFDDERTLLRHAAHPTHPTNGESPA